MRNKISAPENKMSCVDAHIADARTMSDYLLRKEFRGPGDTIEAAIYRAERRWGVPASMLKRLRHRDVADMLLSNWIKLSAAYAAACEQSERQADHQEALARAVGINEDNSLLAKAAALVARQKDGTCE